MQTLSISLKLDKISLYITIRICSFFIFILKNTLREQLNNFISARFSNLLKRLLWIDLSIYFFQIYGYQKTKKIVFSKHFVYITNLNTEILHFPFLKWVLNIYRNWCEYIPSLFLSNALGLALTKDFLNFGDFRSYFLKIGYPIFWAFYFDYWLIGVVSKSMRYKNKYIVADPHLFSALPLSKFSE